MEGGREGEREREEGRLFIRVLYCRMNMNL